jgi:hypothetical protein
MYLRATLYGALCAGLGLGACNGNDAPRPEMAAAQRATAANAGSATAAPAQAPAAAPTLSLQVVGDKPGVGLRVINAGTRTVSLAPQVTLEALQGGSAQTVAKQTLTLQLHCKSTGCVTLSPGAEIDGPAWLGRQVAERCGALLVPPTAGHYRLRVQTCGGAHSEYAEFQWPVE